MDDETELKKKIWDYEQSQRAAERQHDLHEQFIESTNNATITNGQLALRSAVLVNGGAAIALLAYLGNLPVKQAASVAPSLTIFACGVAAALFGIAFAYVTNYCAVMASTSEEKTWEHPYVVSTSRSEVWRTANQVFQVISVIIGFSSLGLFVYGVINVQSAIVHLATP